MVKLKIIMYFLSAFIIISALQACNKAPSPEEKIYTALEKVVTLEDIFKEQQEPLIQLEKQEKELYDKIISLGIKEFDQIVKLSEEAMLIINEREEKINKEKDSIANSNEQFQTVLPIINELEDASLKDEAEDLYKMMENRYKAYDELFNHYKAAIEYDKELYKMFQNKDLTLDELEIQIEKINQTYEKIMKANDVFNQYTNDYNKAKIAFYEHAGLEVEYNEKK